MILSTSFSFMELSEYSCCPALATMKGNRKMMLKQLPSCTVFPGLVRFVNACTLTQVNEIWKSYAENASERLNLFLEAFSAPDNSAALDSISQAKFFSERGDKLLQTIRLVEVSWHTLFIHFCADAYC